MQLGSAIEHVTWRCCMIRDWKCMVLGVGHVYLDDYSGSLSLELLGSHLMARSFFHSFFLALIEEVAPLHYES
jgi:hypothetical protein